MDDLQIKAIALNAACVRLAGINLTYQHGVDKIGEAINMAKEFEKYLKGQKND